MPTVADGVFLLLLKVAVNAAALAPAGRGSFAGRKRNFAGRQLLAQRI